MEKEATSKKLARIVAKLGPTFADPHIVAQIGLHPWLQPKNQAYPENGYVPLPAVNVHNNNNNVLKIVQKVHQLYTRCMAQLVAGGLVTGELLYCTGALLAYSSLLVASLIDSDKGQSKRHTKVR